MSRKNTIILTVLINAGLLVVLFVSAIKTEDKTAVSMENKVVAKEEKKNLPMPVAKLEMKKETVVAASKEKPKQESKKITPSKSTDRFVVVQKGDFLEKIAKKNQVTVDEIIALNQLSNTRLQIGQELRLPSLTPVKTTPVKKQEEEKYYIVKGGDSPWTIAMKNHMQVDELLQLNNMDESKAKRLRPGDRLRIK